MVFLFRRVEFFISRWSNAYSIESLGLSIQTTQVQYSKALCQAGNIVLPSPNITSSKRLWNPFCIVFVSSRLARFAPTKSGLFKLCFAWCVLWEYYGLSFVWAFYRSVINLSLVCVTILAVLAAEDIFPSEQACFGVCSRVGVVCYVLIPSPAVLGIILFCVIVIWAPSTWRTLVLRSFPLLALPCSPAVLYTQQVSVILLLAVCLALIIDCFSSVLSPPLIILSLEQTPQLHFIFFFS